VAWTFLVCVTVSGVAAQTLPRVGIVPFASQIEDSASEALGSEIANAIDINIRIAGSHEVARVSQPLRAPTLAELDSLAARNRFDSIIFGSVDKPNPRQTVFTVALFDRAQGAVVFQNQWTIRSVLETFDTADAIVGAMVSELSDRRMAFGQLALINTGTQGSYRLYINGVFAGDNISRLRLLSGTHRVRVEQERMFGRLVVSESTVMVPEDGTGTLQFTIPGMTEQEARRIDGFLASVERTGPEKAEFDFAEIVSEYVALVVALDHAPYSAEMAERREQLCAEFAGFVSWFGQQRATDATPGERLATQTRRPTAGPENGVVLFRYSRPLDL
jgi:hypothetical protein